MQRSGIWYKVKHPMFDPDLAYQAIHWSDFSETAWAQIVFILPTGHTWGVQNFRCTALMPYNRLDHELAEDTNYYRSMTISEKNQPWATKPVLPNPDVNVDLPESIV